MTDINELRRLAQAATQHVGRACNYQDAHSPREGHVDFENADLFIASERPAEDAAFYAAANPAAVSELLDRLEAAEKEREIDEQRIADLMAELNRVGHENDKLRAKVERINTLEMALRDVAQTLAWMQHGRCRGFSEGPILTTNEALDAARAALEELK